PLPHPLPDRAAVEAESRRSRASLRFQDPLEQAFRRYDLAALLPQMRTSLAAGLAILASFGLLDAALFPGLRPRLWALRYGAACPAVAGALALSFWRRGRPYLPLAYAGALIVGGGALIAVMAQHPRIAVLYYPSLILLLIFAYAFSGLRVAPATAAAAAVTLLYVPLALFGSVLSPSVAVNNVAGLAATNLIGAATGYLLERYRRKDFLQTLLLTLDKRELEASNRALRELSYLDPLTGIPNRRAFDEAFEQEWNRAYRHGYPLSLLLVDIDHFKRFNDELGHLAGDLCLGRVAEVLRSFGGRPGDLAARYGGEEFVLLLAGTEKPAAARLADEIRHRVAGVRIELPPPAGSRGVTVSVGVASVVPGPGRCREGLVAAADAALYRAKALGRNRTEVHRTGAPNAPVIPPGSPPRPGPP
ncbi:MAG: GGDEF domain-containing protein, partial [Deltaproteobacteria bacterium]|nr:GGDEF domain-containing protein [Deltaproteobacteria bacterium]